MRWELGAGPVVAALLLASCGGAGEADSAVRADRPANAAEVSENQWTRRDSIVPGNDAPAVVAYGLEKPELFLFGIHREAGGRYEYTEPAAVTDLETGRTMPVARPPVQFGFGAGGAVGTHAGLYLVGYDCAPSGDPSSAGFGCDPDRSTLVAMRLVDGDWVPLPTPSSSVLRTYAPRTDGPRFAQVGIPNPSSLYLLSRPDPLGATRFR